MLLSEEKKNQTDKHRQLLKIMSRKEAPFFNLALSKSPLGKYFAFGTVPHKESGLSINLHACIARRAKLKQWMSLNPIPPLHFGAHNFHQRILFWLSPPPPPPPPKQ